MRTVVFQSFRTERVPAYIELCMASVCAWTQAQGFEYQFFDDQLLTLVPDSHRQKAGKLLCLVTDLARLVQARAFLALGYDQVIWMDADLFIFRPDRLRLPAVTDFRYCKEVWLHRSDTGEIYPDHKVNNSVCIFGPRAMLHLDEYIQYCHATFQRTETFSNALVLGTEVLTRSYFAIDNLTVIGMLSPALLQALLLGEHDVLSQYVTWQGSPVFALNLCNMLREGFSDAPGLFDYLVLHALPALAETSGDRFAATPASGQPSSV